MFEEVYTRPTTVDSVGLHVDFLYWFPSFREASLKQSVFEHYINKRDLTWPNLANDLSL